MAQVEILYAQTAEVSGPETSVDRRRQHTPVPKALAHLAKREHLISHVQQSGVRQARVTGVA